MNTDEPGYLYEDAPGRRLFPLGNCYITPGIRDSGMSEEQIATFLVEHQHGIWGDLSDEDSLANNMAVHGDGGRILSAYRWTDSEGDERRVWVITEAETAPGVREVTTVLFSDEY